MKPQGRLVPLIHELIARFLEDIAVVTGGRRIDGDDQ